MRYLLCLYLLLVTCLSPAQQTYTFSKLTVSNGLNDNDIHAIGQDKYGYMWFGTLGGLNRFNGYSVQWFTHIPGDSTTPLGTLSQSMLLDSNDRFWIGFENGLTEYDYATSTFKKIKQARNYRINDMVAASKEIIFLATDGGLARFDTRTGIVKFYRDMATDSVMRSYFNNRVFSLRKKGTTLYMGSSKGAFVFDILGESISPIGGNIKKSGAVRTVEVSENGDIWMGTYDNYLLTRKTSLNEIQLYNRFFYSSEQITINNVNEVFIDRDKKMWIITSIDGLLEYIPALDSFRRHLYNSALPGTPSGNLHRCIFQDKNGLIWLGGNNGLNYFNPRKTLFSTILPFDKDLDLRNRKMARAVAEDNAGNLWFATADGVSRYSLSARTYTEWNNRINKPPVIYYNSVRGMLTDKEGNTWIGTGAGVNRYTIKTKSIEFIPADSLPVGFYFAVVKDRKERVWFCTRDYDSFYWYDPVDGSYHSISEHPDLKKLAGYGGRYVFEDSKGRYWFGLNGTGLGFYDPVKRIVKRWTTNDSIETIIGNLVIDIKEDKKGVVWVSTTLGITGIDIERNSFTSFNSKNGLLSNTVAALGVDALDRLWVGTSRGINMIDSTRSIFTSFGIQDGLPTEVFVEHSGYTASNGDFIFPSANSFVRFDPLQFKVNDEPLQFYLSGITVFNKPYPVKGEISDLQELHLNAEESSFSLQFVALHYENPGQTWYAYKLEGFDKDWIYTQKHEAIYTNVPGGNYTFKFKATANPYNWDVPERVLLIKLDTVFYKRTWFQLLAILFTIALLYTIYHYRIRKQKEVLELQGKSQLLEKEKALVMYESLKQQLNPHFLFNSLTSLRSLIRSKPEQAGEFLDGLSRSYRYILKSRDAETVSLADELKFTETYVQLQKTRFPKGFDVNINVSAEYLHRKIVPVIIQNLVENAVKHNLIDAESPLLVEIFQEGDHLVVKNNLQRKEFVETSNKQGLENLQALYHYMTGKPIHITDDNLFFVVKIPLI